MQRFVARFGARANRRPARSAAVAFVAGLALVTLSLPAAFAASAPAQSAGGGQGTVGARTQSKTVAPPAIVHHATSTVPNDASGALSTVLAYQGHYGYTAVGIGMRNLGKGTIDITGVPDGATVKSATLVWDVLSSSTAGLAQGDFDGTAITGTQWQTGASPCWSAAGANYSYEADVTAQVDGNGTYGLTGFASGEVDGEDPWNGTSTPPLFEGATLVVVYQQDSLPTSVIQLDEGATEIQTGSPAAATFTGFTASEKPAASTTYIVADGQQSGNTAVFNDNTLSNVGFPGAAGQAAPNYSQGNLWDTVTTDVSSDVTAGDTSATAGVVGGAGGDCLVWVGQVLDVAAGGPVLGLGDSVTAGYGVGPAEGNGDNSLAYPNVLAGQLGVQGQDDAVEGACASSAEHGPNREADCQGKESLYTQIQNAPKDYNPSLVTISIGADDINFSTCINDIMLYDKSRGAYAEPDTSRTSPKDPCSKQNLPSALDAFAVNFKADLAALTAKYPNAKVLVMDYYNPFPTAAATASTTCGLFSDAALGNEYDRSGKDWESVVGYFFLHHAKYAADAAKIQSVVEADAETIVGELNGTIEAVALSAQAAGEDVDTVDTSDFAGHDLCSADPWVFAPRGTVVLYLLNHPIATVNLGSGAQCIDATAKSEKEPKTIVVGSTTFGIMIQVFINCTPHPTTVGQQQLAQDFLQASTDSTTSTPESARVKARS